jgi:lipopolysaccharide/colanic/teichoic acid biosynthesis glycosyltransferase
LLEKSVIFKQKRLGKNKKVFTIYKIRTMKKGSEKLRNKLGKINEAPSPMFKAKNDPRFLPIGKVLSKFGLDELPQLVNIIRGEMSLIGPRPLPVDEAEKLDETWNFRYTVKPGILSFWALSASRYDSLNAWKQLEKETLEIQNISTEIKLLFIAINQIIIRQLTNLR